MAKRDDNGGTTYGPSWQDVAVMAMDMMGATGYKITWDAHLEAINGRVRTYWKVHAIPPSPRKPGIPPLFTRGDFYPCMTSATVPGLLHRLLSQLDADILRAEGIDCEAQLPL